MLGGDLSVWRSGLTHQLANRPRDVSGHAAADAEAMDELRPYQVSSKQPPKALRGCGRCGPQHGVGLAWEGEYSMLGLAEFEG